MCIQPCREAGTSTGSGNTRITQKASNPTECQVFRATRKAIWTATLMTAHGRNSTTNGPPNQAAIASRAYRSISLQSASNGSQRHAELLREIAGDQTRNQTPFPKTGPELGRLRHPWYNCTAFFLFRDILGWVFSH